MSEPKLAKEVLEDVLGKAALSEIWAVNYSELIPFSLQSFEVGSVLPAIIYMFRRGDRRGAGHFHTTFAPTDGEVQKKRKGSSKRTEPSIASVARVLASDIDKFPGFDTTVSRQILGDLLLCQCLENQHHESGRHLPLIRAFPTHYMASWIDLPRIVVDLRDVPESLVSILADQKSGEVIDGKECDKSWFRIGSDVEHNLLLKVLGRGMQLGHGLLDLHEEFEESAEVGLDQLLTIRMAQLCRAAPQKLRSGKGSRIPNQHPVAKQCSRVLYDDFRILLQAYGSGVPRQCLLPMLDSCIGLGLTNIILSSAKIMFEWEQTGTLPHVASPWSLFVDASSSSDRELRAISEDVMDESYQRLKRLPVILMALRIAGTKAKNDKKLSAELPPRRPDATARINFLGELIQRRHSLSDRLHDDTWEKASQCLDNLRDSPDCGDAVAILQNEAAIPNAVWRMAEAITHLMGNKQHGEKLESCLRSCMMVGESDALAVERRVQFRAVRNNKKSGFVRSTVLSNTMLDFLVHRHLRKAGKKGVTQEHSLSFTEFLTILRERYGLYVDQAPPGSSISMELLLRNRRILEGRLRDLGLLVGVNDAESMKRLRPRFRARDVEVQHDGHE
jgi:hypothetical protein